jgi:hypothetical protein
MNALVERRWAITDGTLDHGHPGVGFLIIGGSTNCSTMFQGGTICSATVIGRRTLLTAAHCLEVDTTRVFCLSRGGETYEVQQKMVHPLWRSNPQDQEIGNDIGLVVLAKELSVGPVVLSQQAPTAGQRITLVGFGSTAAEASDPGEKRTAFNTIVGLWPTRFSYQGTGNGVGNVCDGDSGGPAFAMIEGQEVQVGVTSATGMQYCGSLSFDTRIDAYFDWIAKNAGSDFAQGGGADRQNPQIAITSPANNATIGPNVELKVSASDNVRVISVALMANGATQQVLTKEPWFFSLTLAEGSHQLKAMAQDAAGNEAHAEITVNVSAKAASPGKNSLAQAHSSQGKVLSDDGCAIGKAKEGGAAELWGILLLGAILFVARGWNRVTSQKGGQLS